MISLILTFFFFPGTIFSGMFCLCFGIPRFGVHDGAKHRIGESTYYYIKIYSTYICVFCKGCSIIFFYFLIGSFLINLLVGCGQLFTVLFCLVGWGWSIWWGVIFVKVARKYSPSRFLCLTDIDSLFIVNFLNGTRQSGFTTLASFTFFLIFFKSHMFLLSILCSIRVLSIGFLGHVMSR